MGNVPTREAQSQRSDRLALQGRLGAHVLHSRHDSREITAPARKAFLNRFEREVDPKGALQPEERSRRAAHAKKAYFTRLALLSVKARQEQ
jgi:hypothetical protein